MKIVTVIPLQKNSFKEELTYFSAQNIVLGSIVAISIRNKNTLGLVVSSIDASEAKSQIKEMDFNLKKKTAHDGWASSFVASARGNYFLYVR
jgi:hypothetical protein